MTIVQNLLPLYGLLIKVTVLSLALVTASVSHVMYILKNTFIKVIANTFIIFMDIISYYFLLLVLEKIEIYLIAALLKNLLSGSYFTLFIRFYIISDAD